MKIAAACTILLAACLGLLLAADPAGTDEVPISLPTTARAPGPRRPVRVVPATILDRVAAIGRDPTGSWWTIPDPAAGKLYLLPCELLEGVEDACRDSPGMSFSLSGEVHRYRGAYYLLIERAMLMPSGRATSRPAAVSRPARPSASRPSTQAGVSADEIGQALLSEKPLTPVVGPAGHVRPVASRARRSPFVVNRRARLAGRAGGRFTKLTFESDNTLAEPPLLVLPNEHLERVEKLSAGGTRPGAVFNVSGETYRYRERTFLLIRSALPARRMGRF